MRSPKKLIFATLSLLSILGYGFFVFAAPPGPGGYNPGETLDPECTPGQLVPEPCIVISPLMTADNGLTITGSNVQLGGMLLDHTIIDQDTNNFSFTNGFLGVGTSSPQFTLDVGTNATPSVTPIGFSGTLDDINLDISGFSSGSTVDYNITISLASNPDEVTWSDSRGNVGTFSINGSHSLSYGVIVGFGNDTGHTGDETWYFSVSKGKQGTMNVADQIFINGGFFATSGKQGSVFLGEGVETLPSLNGVFFAGNNAGVSAFSASYSNFIGNNAGYFAEYANNSNFLGQNAGSGAVYANDSNFIGTDSGIDAENAYNSIFLGTRSGQNGFNADSSNFFGFETGYNANNASSSNFMGVSAGYEARYATLSNFIGYQAGYNASNAARSIFIGTDAGYNDTVNNTSGADWSILIGNETSTGGFSNSIALGRRAANTMSDQFYISDTIRFINLRGVNYELPLTDGNNGDVLTTDSAGGLAWLPVGGTSLQWYAENATAPGTAPVATGVGSIALGDNAEALNFDMFVFGKLAGLGATNAASSIFIGGGTGYLAVDASNSVFIGNSAGTSATNATFSNFIGAGAGSGANNAANSIFMGKNAGANDAVNNTAAYNEVSTFANTSILIGHRTSTGGFSNSIALGAYATNTAANQFMVGSITRPISSVFIGGDQGTASPISTFFVGYRAGQNATSASSSNFFGNLAGGSATNASNSNFFGTTAGNSATNASDSNFFGSAAGRTAPSASHSNFFGRSAGQSATSASYSNFFGFEAGNGASLANHSNFFGREAGSNADNANNANFIGNQTGYEATNAAYSNFIGTDAGNGSANAANSIFIGRSAGDSDPVDNTTDPNDYSIAIGNYATPDGFSNSIALGQRATNTDSNEFMIGSTTRRIETMVFNGGVGNTCAINASTGITCSSDERLKTNIIDLPLDSLEKVVALRTVTYNWKTDPTGKSMIGFIAQDLQAQFPELVSQNIDGMLSVNYAGMTPILVEAIREMNLNVTQIADMTRENTWRDALIAWFGNTANGIENFIAGTIRARSQVCIDDVCINKEQLQSILQNNGIINQPSPVISTPPPADDTIVDNTTDDMVTDPNTDTNVSSEELSVSTDDTNSPKNTDTPITE